MSKKKAVVPNPDSISEDGYKAKPAAAKRRPNRKTGVEDLSSTCIHEKVALLAYSYWEKRGRQGGTPEEDWYRAEKEVRAHVFYRNA